MFPFDDVIMMYAPHTSSVFNFAPYTVHTKIYEHGFVILCYVIVLWSVRFGFTHVLDIALCTPNASEITHPTDMDDDN